MTGGRAQGRTFGCLGGQRFYAKRHHDEKPHDEFCLKQIEKETGGAAPAFNTLPRSWRLQAISGWWLSGWSCARMTGHVRDAQDIQAVQFIVPDVELSFTLPETQEVQA